MKVYSLIIPMVTIQLVQVLHLTLGKLYKRLLIQKQQRLLYMSSQVLLRMSRLIVITRVFRSSLTLRPNIVGYSPLYLVIHIFTSLRKLHG